MGDMADYYDSRYEEELDDSDERLAERVALMKQRYLAAKGASVGSTVVCPTCGRSHTKTTYHKVFCSNQKRKTRKVKGEQKTSCKDQYWNTVDDTRRERAVAYNSI